MTSGSCLDYVWDAGGYAAYILCMQETDTIERNMAMKEYLFVLLLPGLVLAGLPAQAETGSSHHLFLLNKIDTKWSLIARANLVTRQGLSDTFFGYADVNLRYQLNEAWSAEGGYRHAFLELGDQWREEYRPMFGLRWAGRLGGGRFSNRHRIELRFFEGNAKNRVRYRNESVWTAPRHYTPLRLTPYISEEFFYDLTGETFTVNWLTFGVAKAVTKGVKWKLGYRLQSQKRNDQWSDRHVLVTGLNIINW